MKRTSQVAVVAIAAALSLTACGRAPSSSQASDAAAAASALTGAAPAAGTASAATVCNYISVAQLSSIEGAAYAAPTLFGDRMCTWIGKDGNSVTITLTRNATAADWQMALAGIQGDQQSGAPAPIAGLGDRAAGVGLEIAVQHGAVVIDIRNGDSPGFGKWPKSTAIANTIIANLPKLH